MDLKFSKSPSPKELSPFELAGRLLKSSILRACLNLTSFRAHSVTSPITKVFVFKKLGLQGGRSHNMNGCLTTQYTFYSFNFEV